MLTKWITLHEIVLAWELRLLLIGGLSNLYNKSVFYYATYIYHYRRYIQFSKVIECDDGKWHICPREKVLCPMSYH